MSTLPPLHQALVDAGFSESLVQADGGLFGLGIYVGFTPTDKYAVLDGEFTVPQLRALAAWMEAAQRVAALTVWENLRQKDMGQAIDAVFAGDPPYSIEGLTK